MVTITIITIMAIITTAITITAIITTTTTATAGACAMASCIGTMGMLIASGIGTAGAIGIEVNSVDGLSIGLS